MSAERPLIVAIDGPSGVGKSTAARLLAKRLGVPYLDTGAMYRAVALAVLDRGADPDDRDAVLAIVGSAEIGLHGRDDGSFEVLLDGAPVETRIRVPRVGEAASKVSSYPEVRERMVALQRACAERFGAVLEGRDIGTKVFPGTPHKFFVTARPEVRHRRRHEQLRELGREVTPAEVAAEMDARDRRDSSREESPLVQDGTYAEIDTSDVPVEEVVERMARAVESGGG
jgi:cytidylate kinase